MLHECEMIDLKITNKKCSERTSRITDWCDICRVRESQNRRDNYD